SMMLFFTFISQGVGRAVSSIAANAVGARDYLTVRRIALSAVTLNALFFIVNGLFFLAFPEKFAELFLPAKVATESRSLIISMVVQACLWLWIATFIDALRWIAMGMLTAVGDTLFMMWTGSTTVWILCILPTYYFVTHWGVPVTYSWVFSGGYYLFVTALYTWRYRQEKWKARLLIES
ncbi:MAG: hypothetical protein KDK48_04665, partial [Chlamydiia bacterium]|nr:hypothetical protein [Chlamydiia bacterium]